MCQFKSGIILKDRVFIPDYDSHTDMLQKLKIEDTEENARRLFVRAELIPPNDDVFAPVSSWKYRVDQDILPEWYAAEVDERRMREAVTEWAKEHIHIGEKIEEINSGTHWIKDGEIGKICGSADIRTICGSAKVGNIYDSATATIPGLVNWEHTKSVCIKDNAVLIDRYNKKIYHSGAFEAVIMGEKENDKF